jgi:uncharacterized protein with HEPN domain
MILKRKDMDKLVNDKVKLLDIARSVDEIQGLTAGMSFSQFAKQTHIKDEVTYLLREIAMASRTLSNEFKSSYGDIDWEVLNNLEFASWDKEIEVDPHGLFYIIKNDLPIIRDQVMDLATVIEDSDEDSIIFY